MNFFLNKIDSTFFWQTVFNMQLWSYFQIPGKVIKLEGGDPGHTIVHKANDLGASTIIMGCRGMGTIRRTLIGSVSDYILHHANCPVVICRHWLERERKK